MRALVCVSHSTSSINKATLVPINFSNAWWFLCVPLWAKYCAVGCYSIMCTYFDWIIHLFSENQSIRTLSSDRDLASCLTMEELGVMLMNFSAKLPGMTIGCEYVTM